MLHQSEEEGMEVVGQGQSSRLSVDAIVDEWLRSWGVV